MTGESWVTTTYATLEEWAAFGVAYRTGTSA